jgi:hypothetical protein
MSGNVAIWRGNSGNSGGCIYCSLIYGLAAHSAKTGPATRRRATVRTDRFEPRPAVVAKGRIRQILALTLRANHNGNQSQMGCIAPNSIKTGAECAQRREQAVYSTRLRRKQVKGFVPILMLASLQTPIALRNSTKRFMECAVLADTCSRYGFVNSTRSERPPP